MRKAIVSTMVTLNGVLENPQNWSFDYWSDEIAQYANEQLLACDTLFMGRLTYEGFSEAWSSRAGSNDFADRMNALPKFVASRTLTSPLTWNATLHKENIAAEFAQLKQQPGHNLLQYGMGELTDTLLKQGLIDELRFLVYPVAVAEGKRIFETIEKFKLELAEIKTFSTGVVALHYHPVR